MVRPRRWGRSPKFHIRDIPDFSLRFREELRYFFEVDEGGAQRWGRSPKLYMRDMTDISSEVDEGGAQIFLLRLMGRSSGNHRKKSIHYKSTLKRADADDTLV
jgi:hypothetical protein